MSILSPVAVLRGTQPPPAGTVEWTAACDRPGCSRDATWRQKAPFNTNTQPEVDCPGCGDSDRGRVAA